MKNKSKILALTFVVGLLITTSCNPESLKDDSPIKNKAIVVDPPNNEDPKIPIEPND